MHTLIEQLELRARENPKETVLFDETVTKGITYEDLNELSGRVYAWLKQKGIGKEDFVLINLTRGVLPVVAIVGILKAGAAFALVEENYAPERIEYIRKDCGCRSEINRDAWEEILKCEPLDGHEQTDDHDAAYAIYTSGTTGNPKGVLHEYGNIEECIKSVKCVLQTVHEIFANIAGCPEEEKIQLAFKRSVEASRLEQLKLTEQIAKDEKQLDTLRAEIANALTGNSVYTSEDLSTAITAVRTRIDESRERLKTLQDEEEQKKVMSDGIIPAYRRFRTWALEFDETSLEGKKMIINELFSRIELSKDYKVRCYVNFTYKQFCTEWATLEQKINATA